LPGGPTCHANFQWDDGLKELERAVKQDDARAVLINSSHHGHYPDEDAARPFWQLVTDLGIPVFIHPGDATTAAMADYRLASSVGRPTIVSAVGTKADLLCLNLSLSGHDPSRT
jgi:predicted TIM-barrel fold metal-dependent hydrolase